MKLMKWRDRWVHWCQGCRGTHQITERWGFNGDETRPTFSPSVRVTYNGPDADQERGEEDSEGGRAPSRCCHYFLQEGQLRFCADSTHALSGQNLDLVDIPEGVVEMYRSC